MAVRHHAKAILKHVGHDEMCVVEQFLMDPRFIGSPPRPALFCKKGF